MYTAFIKNHPHTGKILKSLAGSVHTDAHSFFMLPSVSTTDLIQIQKITLPLESLSLNKTARDSFILTFSPIILDLLLRVGKCIAAVYTKKLAVLFKDVGSISILLFYRCEGIVFSH